MPTVLQGMSATSRADVFADDSVFPPEETTTRRMALVPPSMPETESIRPPAAAVPLALPEYGWLDASLAPPPPGSNIRAITTEAALELATQPAPAILRRACTISTISTTRPPPSDGSLICVRY